MVSNMEYSKFGTDDTYSKYTKDNDKCIFHELVDDVSNLDFMNPATSSHPKSQVLAQVLGLLKGPKYMLE